MQATFQNPSTRPILDIPNPFWAFAGLSDQFIYLSIPLSESFTDIEAYGKIYGSTVLRLAEYQVCARELYKRIVQSPWVDQHHATNEMQSLAEDTTNTMMNIILAMATKGNTTAKLTDELINNKLSALLDKLASMQLRFGKFALKWDAFAGSSDTPPKAPPAQADPPAITTAPPAPTPQERHSPDYRSVHWFGVDYCFTATQAPVVKLLWEAFFNCTPDISDDSLLRECGSDAGRLRDVFKMEGSKMHLAWSTLIVNGSTKGTHRLAPRPF